MKINLAENMLRFGVKNLNETAISKVKTLAEQAPVQPAAAATVKQIPGSTFNYAVGGGGSDQAKRAPLAVIVEDIDIMKFNGTTTNVVDFRNDLIAFGTVVGSETEYNRDSIKPMNIPTSIQAVERVANHVGSDLANTLKAIAWLSQNYQQKFGAGNSIVKFLTKLNSEGTFAQVYKTNANQGAKFGNSQDTWITAMKSAGIIRG